MNYTQTLEPRQAFRLLWARTFNGWLVGPAPLIVTCDEFLGKPEEAIVEEGISVRLDNFALPEIEAEEFERVFQWFQT